MGEMLEHLLKKAGSYRQLAENYPPGTMREGLLQTADGYDAQAKLVAARLMSEDI